MLALRKTGAAENKLVVLDGGGRLIGLMAVGDRRLAVQHKITLSSGRYSGASVVCEDKENVYRRA